MAKKRQVEHRSLDGKVTLCDKHITRGMWVRVYPFRRFCVECEAEFLKGRRRPEND